MIFRLFVVVERRDAQFNFSFLTLLLQLSHSTSRLPSYSILDCILSFIPYVPIFPRQLPTTKKTFGSSKWRWWGRYEWPGSKGAEERSFHSSKTFKLWKSFHARPFLRCTFRWPGCLWCSSSMQSTKPKPYQTTRSTKQQIH